MWLFSVFNLFYVFCVSFLPVILDTGFQVAISEFYFCEFLAPGVEWDRDQLHRFQSNT